MTDESTQSRGIGTFAFAAIPWVLAIGATAWLGLYMAFHEDKKILANDRKELTQEERMATYVGAAERPQQKVKIEEGHSDCVALSRAEFDGTELLMYAENRCHGAPLDYLAWHWQLIAPDGTALSQGYTNLCPIPTNHGQKAECKQTLREHRYGYEAPPIEDRVEKIVIWLKTSP